MKESYISLVRRTHDNETLHMIIEHLEAITPHKSFFQQTDTVLDLCNNYTPRIFRERVRKSSELNSSKFIVNALSNRTRRL